MLEEYKPIRSLKSEVPNPRAVDQHWDIYYWTTRTQYDLAKKKQNNNYMTLGAIIGYFCGNYLKLCAFFLITPCQRSPTQYTDFQLKYKSFVCKVTSPSSPPFSNQ